jgi:hypothetical protein
MGIAASRSTASTAATRRSEIRLNMPDRVDSPERPEQPEGRSSDGGASR